MRKNILLLQMIAVAAAGFALAAGPTFAAQPSLKLTLLPEPGAKTARTLPDGSFPASSVRPIVVEVTLRGDETHSGLNVGQAEADAVRIKVWMLGTVRQEVPARVRVDSRSIEYGIPSTSVVLDIPIPDEQQIAATKAFVDRVIATTTNEFTRTQLQQQRESMVAYFRTRYLQNRLGKFEIVATYTGRDPGGWTGTIERSLIITVQDKGTFFDELGKQIGMPAVER